MSKLLSKDQGHGQCDSCGGSHEDADKLWAMGECATGP